MESFFSEITFKQIKTLLDVIHRAKDKSLERIEILYPHKKSELIFAMEFLKGMKLIYIKDKKILLAKSVQKIFDKPDLINDQLKHVIANQIFNKNISYRVDLLEYLNNFELIDFKYLYKPSRNENLRYSGIRNFLLEIGIIQYHSTSKTYYVSSNRTDYISKALEGNKLNYDEFKQILINNEEIGRAAEEAVLTYEFERLKNYPELVSKIEYVSQKNVLAGFDIKSWEERTENSNKEFERFIEVKCISPSDHKFFWTRNEINVAEKFKNKYCLYLVPVINKMKFEINNIEIIRDPVNKLFNNNLWEMQIESYSFKKKQKDNY